MEERTTLELKKWYVRKWDELAKTKSILQTLIYDLEKCEINISKVILRL